DKDEMPRIIEAKNRALAGRMAPANGLYLYKVYY
ncbi:tRNA pseudouridine(38-40) synthase TruA, partial [Lacrimispora saccharolytica]|nr:tRNA pseudouridine(38-40) synthase TruA [Lacrimispora saccharolytica]